MTFKRDSIGRSDAYNNPYDTRYVSNPSIKKFRAEHSQDTMESQQTILERNLLNQMKDGSIKLPKGSLVYIVYIGKGLFLMIMVPTYLFFYGIPKWVMMQAGPAVINVLKKAMKALKEQFVETILAKFQEIARKLATQLGKLGRSLNEAFSAATEALKSLKKFSDQLKDITAESLRRMNQAFDAAMSPFRKGKEWVKSKANAFAEGATAIYKKVIETIASPFQAMAEAIKASVKKATELAERTKKAISETLEKNLFSPLRTFGKKLTHAAEKLTRPIVEALKKHILEPYREFARKVNKLKESIVEAVRERHEKIIETVRAFAHKATELYHKVSENIAPAAMAIAQGIINLIPQPLINFFIPIATAVTAVWRASGRMKKRSQKLIMQLKKFNHWTKAQAKWMAAKVKKGMQQLSKALLWVVEQAKKIPSKVWKFLCATAVFLVEVGKRIFFLLRLLCAWIKVLIRFSWWNLRRRFA